MAWLQTAYLFVFVLTTVAMTAISVLAYRARETDGATPLAVLALLVAVWTGAVALRTTQPTFGGKRFLTNITYFSIALIPIALLYFVTEYTNHDSIVTRYGPAPLLVVPALTQVFVWTNSSFEFMWAERGLERSSDFAAFTTQWGPWFWVHSAHSYAVLVVASVLLVRWLMISDLVYRWQATSLLTGVFTPWFVNALYLGGFLPVLFDPTPIAFSVSALAFLTAIYRHELLELTPIARDLARDELMDNLAEAVFVLDERGAISDLNDQAAGIASEPRTTLVGSHLEDVVPALADAIGLTTDDPLDNGHRTEVALRRAGSLRHYDVEVTELDRGGGLLAGHLVSLLDVTQRRQREQRLDVLNRTLRHDLRNEANVILGYADLGMQTNPDAEWLEEIKEHVDGLVDLSDKVRQIEQALDQEDVDPQAVDISSVVRAVVTDVEATHPTATIDTELPESQYTAAIELIDSAIENALENAIEHNSNPAPLAEVSTSVWETDDGDVAIEIRDNGPGIPEDEREVLLRGRETQLEHVSGLGLWIINWIVTESGGTITFDEADPHGSILTIRLPAADAPPDSERAEEADTRDRDPTAIEEPEP